MEKENAASPNEGFVLPVPYVGRTVVQVAPLSPLSGLNLLSQEDDKAMSQSVPWSTEIPPRFEDKTFHKLPLKNRLRFIYGLPGHGTTSLLLSQIVNVQKKAWISYVNLRKAMRVLSDKNKELDETWTLSQILIQYSNITDKEEINRVNNLFPVEKVMSENTGTTNSEVSSLTENICKSEIFLDEIDEIKLEYQKIVIAILKKINWAESSTRVWVASRPHVKELVNKIFDKDEDGIFVSSFELVPLLRTQQIEMMVKCFCAMAQQSLMPGCSTSDNEMKIIKFTTDIHTALEHYIPNFYRTLGACPTHLFHLAKYFREAFVKFMGDTKDFTEYYPAIFKLSAVDILEMLVKEKFSLYFQKLLEDKPTKFQPKNEQDKTRMWECEYHRLIKFHVKFAISTINHTAAGYSSQNKFIFHRLNNQDILEFHLFQIGILYKLNGKLEFMHDKYAEFLIAQFFVNCGRFNTTGVFLMTFFLNKMLFADNCKSIRKYFNDYWGAQQERKKINMGTGWVKLREFIIIHYCLNEGLPISSSSGALANKEKEEPENLDVEIVEAEGNENVSYKIIKNWGSILHLTLFEGNIHIYEMILNSFRNHPKQLRRLLEITVDMHVLDDNPFHTHPDKFKLKELKEERHTMPTFHLFALFAKGDQQMMEKLIRQHLKVYSGKGGSELSKYFLEGKWTPFHYAAMSSNYEFLRIMIQCCSKEIKGDVTSKNPKGQEASHIAVGNQCYYYSMTITDRPHAIIRRKLQSHSKVQNNQNPKTEKNQIATITTGGSKRQLLEEDEHNKFFKKLKKSCSEIKSYEGTIKNFREGEFNHNWEYMGGAIAKLTKLEDDENSNFLRNDMNRHLKVLDLLVTSGCKVNTPQGVDGKTLLHLVAPYRAPELVNYLLDKGAEADVKDDVGKYPKYYSDLMLKYFDYPVPFQNENLEVSRLLSVPGHASDENE